jgi:hypothetical protein
MPYSKRTVTAALHNICSTSDMSHLPLSPTYRRKMAICSLDKDKRYVNPICKSNEQVRCDSGRDCTGHDRNQLSCNHGEGGFWFSNNLPFRCSVWLSARYSSDGQSVWIGELASHLCGADCSEQFNCMAVTNNKLLSELNIPKFLDGTIWHKVFAFILGTKQNICGLFNKIII